MTDEATGMKEFWKAEAIRQNALLKRIETYLRHVNEQDKKHVKYAINGSTLEEELTARIITMGQLIEEIEGQCAA